MMAVPGRAPGASEHSHGAGMFPNPETDYDPGGSVSGFKRSAGGITYKDVANGQGTLQDQLRVMSAEKRTNTLDKNAEADPMVAGNPDRFGPAHPLVKQPPEKTPREIFEEPRAEFRREW